MKQRQAGMWVVLFGLIAIALASVGVRGPALAMTLIAVSGASALMVFLPAGPEMTIRLLGALRRVWKD
jgi:hypothetical protein